MTDVFISYSRKDSDFAHRLVDALAERDRDSWVDWRSIPYSEDWWLEICNGIINADNFILILSPNSLSSMICNKEIEFARECNKRIIPVIYREVASQGKPLPEITQTWFGEHWRTSAEANWHEIQRLNWLFFRPEDDFDRAFQRLIETVDQDTEYIRIHTQVLRRATLWRDNRASTLRGDELLQAEAWLLGSVDNSPAPGELHREFIRLSRHAANRQRQLAIGVLSVALVITMFLAAVSFVQFQQAERQRQRADSNAVEAQIQAAEAATSAADAIAAQATAERNAEIAEENLLEVWNTQALFLAGLAQQELNDGAQMNALLLAQESLANYPTIFNPESSRVLVNALIHPWHEITAIDFESPLTNIGFTDGEVEIITTESGVMRAFSMHTGKEVRRFQHTGDQSIVGFSFQELEEDAEETPVLTWSRDGAARIWIYETGELLHTFQHGERVLLASWRSDYQRVLTSSFDGTARVWDAETGQQIATTPAGTGLYGASYSPDESRILVWGLEGRVEVYDGDLNQRQLDLVGHSDEVNGVAWSADGNYVLGWSVADNVFVWDANSGILLGVIENSASPAYWHPTDLRIVTGGDGFSVSVWDLTEGLLDLQMEHDSSVLNTLWNGDGSRILSYSADGTARIWDATTGREQLRFTHDAQVNYALWLDEGTKVATTSLDGSVRIYDANTGELLSRLQYNGPALFGLLTDDLSLVLTLAGEFATPSLYMMQSEPAHNLPKINLDSSASRVEPNADETLFAVDLSNDVALWDATSDEPLWRYDFSSSQLLGWTPDESGVLVWSRNHPGLVMLDAVTGNERFTLGTDGDWRIQGVEWNSDRLAFLTWDTLGQVFIFDTQSLEVQRRLQVMTGVGQVLWISDDEQILTLSDGNRLQVWDISSAQVVAEHTPATVPVTGIAWNSNAESLAYIQGETEVVIWNIVTESVLELQHLNAEGEAAEIDELLWFADGTRLLTRSDFDSTRANLWDAVTGELLQRFDHRFEDPDQQNFFNSDRIIGMSLSRDETILITWSGDTTVRFWDIATGAEQRRLIHSDRVLGTMLDDDESHLLAWTDDNNLYVWELATERELVFIPISTDVQGAINGMVWLADDIQMMSWDFEGLVTVWPATVEGWLQMALEVQTRDFTPEQRASFYLSP